MHQAGTDLPPWSDWMKQPDNQIKASVSIDMWSFGTPAAAASSSKQQQQQQQQQPSSSSSSSSSSRFMFSRINQKLK